MSKETLHLLMTMNHDNLETQIAMQCAPLLTGMKISNLLTVGSRKKQEVLRTFRRTSISCYVLYESGEKTTFLLYRKQKLESYLDQPQIKQLMERFGYGCQDPVSILRLVSRRYKAHMEGGRGFPHEIGVLLGYPPEDVIGFIENNGKNFLCVGYWKVYSNLNECRSIFRRYNHAREHVIHMVSHGMDIADILEVYGLKQYKSMTIGG